MHVVHAWCQGALLGAGIFLTFDSHLQPIEHGYLIGLYLNMCLLSVAVAVESGMTNCVGKRLILWLLYYEILTPLLFIFVYLMHAQSGAVYILNFFVFYLCMPLAYFSHLTLLSIAEFMQDSEQGLAYQTLNPSDRQYM